MSSIFTIGGKTVQDITIGAKQVQSIYDNTNQLLLWEKAQPNYFYFEDRSGTANNISIAKTGDQAEWLSLEYSTDKNTWSTWDFAQTLTLPANGKVWLRGNNTYGFGKDSSNYHTFGCTGNYAVGGGLWSILQDSITTYPDRFGSRTFNESTTLVDISNLNFGNLTISTVTFTWMFQNCTSLVSLPSEIGVSYHSSVNPTTANSHFYRLFYCTNIENFPTFPNISVLAQRGMYNIAMSSSTSPNTVLKYVDLSNINTLYTEALANAFQHCRNLEVVKIGISEWGDFNDSTATNYRPTINWLGDVHSTGVFCKNSTLPVTRGNNYIPTDWSIADLNGKLYAPVITNTNNTITIAEAEGGASCQIWYTTDGTTPTPQNGTLYTQPFNVSSGTTVKAIAHYNGNRADLITDSDYSEVTTGAISVSGYPFGEPQESGYNLRDNVPYFCVGTPDNGEHYYLMKNSNWSEDVYNTKTSYYDNGTPITIGTDVNGRLYIASADIANPNLYKRTLTRNSGQGIGHFYGNLQYNPSDTPDPGTRLWNDPNAFERDKGMWMPSANGATWYSGYRLKYGAVTHGGNNLGNCFYLSTNTTNDYSIMFFKAVSQVIYINN